MLSRVKLVIFRCASPGPESVARSYRRASERTMRAWKMKVGESVTLDLGFPTWAVAAIYLCWLMISWGIKLSNLFDTLWMTKESNRGITRIKDGLTFPVFRYDISEMAVTRGVSTACHSSVIWSCENWPKNGGPLFFQWPKKLKKKRGKLNKQHDIES